MAQDKPQRKETPPGPSPNSPSLLFEYQCTSGKFIRLANRIESKKNRFGRENRIESNRNFFVRIGMLYHGGTACTVTSLAGDDSQKVADSVYCYSLH